jgi:SAM-dependent methyltransferase
MPLTRLAKRALRRSVVLTALAYAAHDTALGWRLRRGRIGTRLGASTGDASAAEGADYVQQIFGWYLDAAGQAGFAGDVAEIGPGDTLGAGLLCRAGGARHYVGIDRFEPYHDKAHQRAIYAVLAQRVGRPDLLAPDRPTGLDGVDYVAGEGAETYFRTRPRAFDTILSNAVLEHCQDPLAALDDMLAALRPGGLMIHVVDLRDHGMFAGHHPLTHLTPPDWMYRRMVQHSGHPNRVPFSAYRAWLERSGEAGSLTCTRVIGGADRLGQPPSPESAMVSMALVSSIRRRLALRFREEADTDLSVATFTLVLRRRN